MFGRCWQVKPEDILSTEPSPLRKYLLRESFLVWWNESILMCSTHWWGLSFRKRRLAEMAGIHLFPTSSICILFALADHIQSLELHGLWKLEQPHKFKIKTVMLIFCVVSCIKNFTSTSSSLLRCVLFASHRCQFTAKTILQSSNEYPHPTSASQVQTL